MVAGRACHRRHGKRLPGWHRACVKTGMRYAFALLLVAHGVAHLVGFVSAWKLATLAELPYRTTLFSGHLDVGEAGIRLVGVLWLLAALTFLVAAVAVANEGVWARRALSVALLVSAPLCAAAWPEARLGLAVDMGLALLLAIGVRQQWPMLVH